MIDFQSLRASLASVSIMPPRESTEGLNGLSDGGCRRGFSRTTALRCFWTSLELLWAAESSSVVAKGKVAVWESWEARETMVMSMSWLERPLAADPMILMSSRRSVPVTKGSRWTWAPSTVARACPIACLTCSCLATVQGALLTHISSCPSWFLDPQCLQCLVAPGSRVCACGAAETSKSVRRRVGEKGMTESHFLPSTEDASMTDLALCGSKDSRSVSLVVWKASWHRYRCERTVWLAVYM
jgi:hypothetical protein